MPTQKHEKLTGAVSLWSNSYGAPTGYGQQAKLLIDRLKRSGLDTAMLSNYGLEGSPSIINTPYGEVPHYPRGIELYSNDSAPIDHAAFIGQYPNKNNLLISLYDVWVMQSPKYSDFKIASWVPLDHITIPPRVEKVLKKDNVHPIAMAPHGVRQLTNAGIECDYVPHAIDTKLYKPTQTIRGGDVNEYLGIKPDQFLVGMVAANKASGLVHRKAFSEAILAFSIFMQDHPDAVLYLHTDAIGAAGGWNLISLLTAAGITKDRVLFPDRTDYRYGLHPTDLAALYTRMDVLLAPSYGEGFGVPTMEALACGTRVIGSNWAATPDLLSEDSWLIDGQPSWDSGQDAWWQVPSVPSIVNALSEAYKSDRGTSMTAVKFAQDFDADVVWDRYWVPVLKKLLQ